MTILLGMAMAAALPEPDFEQATICSALTARLAGSMTVKANRAGASDDDRNNLRLNTELHTRAAAKALALLQANPLSREEIQRVRKRVTETVARASTDPWQKLAECAALFAVK